MPGIIKAKCKHCGVEFAFQRQAAQKDLERGWSPPERCNECRKLNDRFIKQSGAAYWVAPIETDPRKKAWGKRGFGRLVRNGSAPTEINYNGVPIDDPPNQFKIIAPVAKALVQNLQNPNGTRVSVLVGPTGTGKSTWVPYRLLRSDLAQRGQICVTQPRLATLKYDKEDPGSSSTPAYIATQLCGAPGIGAGFEVGYQYRGEYGQHDRHSRLVFVSDGTLLNWLRDDDRRMLDRFSVIMIDEAHEQSVNMELLFALLKYKLPLYPRLRVIIASATINVQAFREFFSDGEDGEVFVAEPKDFDYAETNYPIHLRYPEEYGQQIEQFVPPIDLEKRYFKPNEVAERITQIVSAIRNKPSFSKLGKTSGDILVFVPTLTYANAAFEQIQNLKLKNSDVVLCHAKMTRNERKRFDSGEERAAKASKLGKQTTPSRIIVATNYVETSITISNLSHVIDTGLILKRVFDEGTRSNRYEVRLHTQAECNQRKGRVGRAQEGECFRLFSKETFEGFDTYPDPEIGREALELSLLRLKAAGIHDISNVGLLGLSDESDKQRISLAIKYLQRTSALDHEGDITTVGTEIDRTGSGSIDLARILSKADMFGCALEVATFMAFLELDADVFATTPAGLRAFETYRQNCKDDLEFYLRIFENYRSATQAMSLRDTKEWCRQNGLRNDALQQVQFQRGENLAQYGFKTHDDISERALDLRRLDRARYLVAVSSREWVFQRNEETKNTYVPLFPEECPSSQGIQIDETSSCKVSSNVSTVFFAERSTRRDELFGKHVIIVDPEWVLEQKEAFASDVSIALRMKSLIHDTDNRGKELADLFYSKPKPITAPSLESGQEVVVQVVRVTGTNEGKPSFLATERESGIGIIAQLDEYIPKSGDVVRAIVQSIEGESGIVVLSQAELKLRLETGSILKQLEVIKTGTDGDGHPLWKQLQIEAGIIGILPTRLVHPKDKKRYEQAANGANLDAVLWRVANDGSIEFVSKEMFAEIERAQRPGEKSLARVIRAIDGVEGRIAVELELVPGVRGRLNETMVAVTELKKFNSLEKDDQYEVYVTEVREDERVELCTPKVWKNMGAQVSSGDVFRGVVRRFLTDRDTGDRYAALVELIPGVIGRLGRTTNTRFHIPNGLSSDMVIGQRKINRLRTGEKLDIVVSNVDRGRIFVGPKLNSLTQDAVYRGNIVSIFRNEESGTAFMALVEIQPGLIGGLHIANNRNVDFETLRDHQEVQVQIKSIRPDPKKGQRIDLIFSNTPHNFGSSERLVGQDKPQTTSEPKSIIRRLFGL